MNLFTPSLWGCCARRAWLLGRASRAPAGGKHGSKPPSPRNGWRHQQTSRRRQRAMPFRQRTVWSASSVSQLGVKTQPSSNGLARCVLLSHPPRAHHGGAHVCSLPDSPTPRPQAHTWCFSATMCAATRARRTAHNVRAMVRASATGAARARERRPPQAEVSGTPELAIPAFCALLGNAFHRLSPPQVTPRCALLPAAGFTPSCEPRTDYRA